MFTQQGDFVALLGEQEYFLEVLQPSKPLARPGIAYVVSLADMAEAHGHLRKQLQVLVDMHS